MDYNNIDEVKEIDSVINFISDIRKRYVAEIQAKEKEMGGNIIADVGSSLRHGIVELENTQISILRDKLSAL